MLKFRKRHSSGISIESILLRIVIALSALCAPTVAKASAAPAGNCAPAKAASADHTTKIEQLARTDHIALIKYALENYKKNIRDYTGIFHKQERLGKKLGKRPVIEFKFMEKPYSILMNWKENAGSTDKLLFVEGENKGKMLVHPTGLLSGLKSVKLHPRGKLARKSSRQTCDQFGFHRTLIRMLDLYELAKKNGDLDTKYLGYKTIDGRKRIGIERILPKKEGYATARLITYFDVEYALPTSNICYDWDGKLVGEYHFTDLEFNVGLTSKQFAARVNKL